MIRLWILLIVLTCCAAPGFAADMEITPFRTVNQSPLVQIFGIPAESTALVTEAGRISVTLAQDIASNFSRDSNSHESITLDGESYRWTVAARYGIGKGFEAGITIPYILYGGGFLDGFVESWHDAFGLPNGGRDTAPRDRLLFTYRKDGVRKLNMSRATSGIGDISINGAMKLYEAGDTGFHDSLALRAALKLPTGESNALRGSGSTDFSLSLCGDMNNFTEWGSLGLFGSAGGMVMTEGDVLPDQQNNLVAFGTVGLGWGPAEWISFKLQLNGHTAFYRNSSLTELSDNSLMLVGGGAVKLPGGYLLDIGVSEDVAVATAPDVGFHLGLSRRFENQKKPDSGLFFCGSANLLRGHYVPDVVDALTIHILIVFILEEVVQRLPFIGCLFKSVITGNNSDSGSINPGTRFNLFGKVDGPAFKTASCSDAHAFSRLVLFEQVQRHAFVINQIRADAIFYFHIQRCCRGQVCAQDSPCNKSHDHHRDNFDCSHCRALPLFLSVSLS